MTEGKIHDTPNVSRFVRVIADNGRELGDPVWAPEQEKEGKRPIIMGSGRALQ